jgi:hypothetical protein
MSGSPWQRYQPPAGAVGDGPVGIAKGGAAATASDVMVDGDGNRLGVRLENVVGLGKTPELDDADRWRPLPTTRPTTKTTTTTAAADPIATSHGRDEVVRLGSSIMVILPPAEPAARTQSTLSWFRSVRTYRNNDW